MQRVVISLSSIPPRLPHIGPVLEALLAQRPAPDEVRLNLPHRYRRFPDWDGAVPPLPAGVTLCRGGHDHGPICKLLPTLEALRDAPDAVIVFCDDDCLYPQGWLAGLLRAAAARPDAAIVAAGRHIPLLARAPRAPDRLPRMRRAPPPDPAPHVPDFADSGYADLVAGWAGVLVRPAFFPDGLAPPPAVAWAVDDIWISAALEHAGRAIWLQADIPRPVRFAPVDRQFPLFTAVIDGLDRRATEAAALAHVRRTYALWLPPKRPLAQRLAGRLARLVGRAQI